MDMLNHMKIGMYQLIIISLCMVQTGEENFAVVIVCSEIRLIETKWEKSIHCRDESSLLY